MNRLDRQIAREFRDSLCTRVPVVDLRVYGSRAREQATGDSDMDIAVVVGDLNETTREIIADTAWEVGIEHLIHISPLVFSKAEIDTPPMNESPVVRNIMREGVVP